MNKITTIILLVVSVGIAGKLKIVTSTTDLADIASTIGGEHVSVSSIARGNQDPHYVEVLPSYMIKVKRADIYFMVGMELDLWAQQIIDGSRNRKLEVVDCSTVIKPLEKPTGKVDASMGDIHRYGNPHYWLDPENGLLIAEKIADVLITFDPENEAQYSTNLNRFSNSIRQLLVELHHAYAFLDGKNVIFYHNSWPYFTRQFGLNTVTFVEPKPGISPSPAYLDNLIKTITSQGIRLLAQESYFNTDAAHFLSQKTGIAYVKLSQSVGAVPEVTSYPELFRYNLKLISSAF